MNPDNVCGTEKKSSYDLPIGTTVAFNLIHWTITNSFEDPRGAGPQYRIEREDGQVEKSVHHSNVKWVADPKPAPKFTNGDRVQYKSWVGKLCVGKVLSSDEKHALRFYTVELDDPNAMLQEVPEDKLSPYPEAPKPAVTFQKDDRVKFRHNGKCGTVVAVSNSGQSVEVSYDGGSLVAEAIDNLTLLHSPAAKAAEDPHPMQKAIDVIDEERRTVGLQIEALQRRSAELKKAKELLVRGV